METLEIITDQEWKEIPVDLSLLDKEFFDGFCGIEELTDYKIVRKSKASKDIPALPGLEKKTLNKKRKLEVEEVPEQKTVVTNKKKKKQKVQHEKQTKDVLKQVKVKTSSNTRDTKTVSSGDQAAKEEALVEKKDVLKPGKVKTSSKTRDTKTISSGDQAAKEEALVEKKDVLKPVKVKKSYNTWATKTVSSYDQAANEEAFEETSYGWKDLFVPEPVVQALADLGFTAPTSIQALTLPSAIRDGMDIVGAAETGSGKTLAFGIPIINNILRDKEKEAREAEEDQEEVGEDSKSSTDVPSKDHKNRNTKLRCLIMTPTRELAIQIKDHLVAITKYTDIKIGVIVGGFASEKQYRILKRQPDIVIGTPGRLWELIQEGEPHLATVFSIKYLVIDEADRLLEKGHFEELLQILDRINSNEESKAARQTFVFSATLTLIHALPHRVVAKQKKRRARSKQLPKLEKLLLAVGVKEKRKIVDITREVGTAETLMEARINCSLKDKDVYLYYFLTQYPGRTLVFCNSIDCVRRLNNIFALLQCKPWPLHAQMHQKQRLKNLERFTTINSGLVLATDVAARGLDIPNVEHVIHYQVPRTSEAYVHRSGRTARATKEGLSIMLIEPNEVQLYRKICKTLNREKDVPIFPVDAATLRQAKLRVDLARKLDLQEHRSRKQRSHNNWFEKAAEDMGIELDKEELLKNTGEEYDQAKNKRENKQLQLQLSMLLKSAILPQTLTMRYPTYMTNLNAMLTHVPEPEKAVTVMKKENTSNDKQLTRASAQFKLGAKKPKNKKKYRKKH